MLRDIFYKFKWKQNDVYKMVSLEKRNNDDEDPSTFTSNWCKKKFQRVPHFYRFQSLNDSFRWITFYWIMNESNR